MHFFPSSIPKRKEEVRQQPTLPPCYFCFFFPSDPLLTSYNPSSLNQSLLLRTLSSTNNPWALRINNDRQGSSWDDAERKLHRNTTKITERICRKHPGESLVPPELGSEKSNETNNGQCYDQDATMCQSKIATGKDTKIVDIPDEDSSSTCNAHKDLHKSNLAEARLCRNCRTPDSIIVIVVRAHSITWEVPPEDGSSERDDLGCHDDVDDDVNKDRQCGEESWDCDDSCNEKLCARQWVSLCLRQSPKRWNLQQSPNLG